VHVQARHRSAAAAAVCLRLPGGAEPPARTRSILLLLPLPPLLLAHTPLHLHPLRCSYKLDSNQEIMGLGLANFGGAAFSAYTTTGSFSRSAVNNDSGARTGLAGFVTFVVVGFVLLFLTPVFEQLPMNALGAIVISGVAGLFDYEMAWELWQLRKADWAVWMASFMGTMFFGVEYGLAISIGLAMMIVIYESAFPHTAMLGRIGLTTVYRNVKQYPHAARSPGVLPMRIDAPLYFANVQYVRDRVTFYMGKHRGYSAAHGWQQPLEYVILDLSPVSHMDAAGVHMLHELHAELKAQAVQLALCNPSQPVVQMMERAGLPEKLGKEWIYVNVHDAVTNCQLVLRERVAAESKEEQANISYTSAEL
jgi:sulfate transporter 4